MKKIPEPKVEVYLNRLHQALKDQATLEKDYDNKFKGQVYFTRFDLIESRIEAFSKRIKEMGKAYNIIRVTGETPKKIRSDVKMKQAFEIMLTDIHLKDAAIVIRRLLPDAINLNFIELPVGEINYII